MERKCSDFNIKLEIVCLYEVSSSWKSETERLYELISLALLTILKNDKYDQLFCTTEEQFQL
jgi:hypothetical protein